MADDVDRTLYIRNIDTDVTEGLLYELFLQAGPVDRVIIKGNFAFVTFEDEDSVMYACSLLEGTKLYGRELFIKPRSGSKFENVRVQSVPPNINYDSLIRFNNTTEGLSTSTTPQLYSDQFPGFSSVKHCSSFTYGGGFDPSQSIPHSASFSQLSFFDSSGGFLSNSIPGPTNPYGDNINDWNDSFRQRMDTSHHGKGSRDFDGGRSFYNSRAHQGSYDRHYYTSDSSHGALQGKSKRLDRACEVSLQESGLEAVKRIILVLSGKGGVGKSTVSAQLAICLWKKGYRVGLLDLDICGPSIPQLLGLNGRQVLSCSEGWIPVYADSPSQRFPVMSLGFLVNNTDSAVIWRGPRKSGMVTELLQSVCWGQLDFLLVDTPPGTSDEHLSVVEQVQRNCAEKLTGAIVVSTPQRVSLCDVRRELNFCEKTNVKTVGLVENMSGYQCPNCANCCNLFSSGGVKALATEKNIPFLGRLPLDPTLTLLCDSGEEFSGKARTTAGTEALLEAVLRHILPEVT